MTGLLIILGVVLVACLAGTIYCVITVRKVNHKINAFGKYSYWMNPNVANTVDKYW